jgi:AcrR family transcriptional regulator
MISEKTREAGVLSATGRHAGALYPKLRPGPRPAEGENVASNQRARLYGAMIELVAIRGYEASTVADLCALAGVSKRTLYERFAGGKQQCFLTTYDIVVHRAETHILAAGRCGLEVTAGVGPLERLRALVTAFAQEVATYPNAARLVLVEAPRTGPLARERVQRTKRLAERSVYQSLREDSLGTVPSGLVVGRVVESGARVVRARLCERRTGKLTDDLVEACLAAAAPSWPGLGAVEDARISTSL